MEPLTPNTAAFLSFLSNPDEFSPTPAKSVDPTPKPISLPPSAFFPVPGPGQITPEQTPPSQDDSPADLKPAVSLSSDSESDGDDEPSSKAKDDSHKRKSFASNNVGDEGGHEDKRQHGAARSKGRPSEDGLSKKDKAARRKEQNRAAQKAFRERREAKVKDLEDKVAELEAKSFGVTVENENLRGLLKRLQEENVSLKQSAFTFTMPVQQTKPPTPPHSNSDDVLRTIAEPDRSPESLPSASSTTSSSRNLFSSPPRLDSSGSFSRSDSGISPPSVNSNSDNRSELDALWASFYPNGISNIAPAQNGTQQPFQLPMMNAPVQPQVQQRTQQPFVNANANATPSSFAPLPPANNINQPRAVPNMAYRDAPLVANPEPVIAANDPNEFDWSSLGNVDDFLASLVDNNNTKQEEVAPLDDDSFNAQLAQILSGNTFSPTNYLNMSPSPINSISNSASPQSQQLSSAASPESSIGSSSSVSGGVSAAAPVPVPASASAAAPGTLKEAACGIVHVLDEQGNIIKPSDLWVRMGMQHQSDVDHLMIDDLCDQMKAKATCKDGQTAITVDNFKYMMRNAAGDDQNAKRMGNLKQRISGAVAAGGDTGKP